MGRVLHVQCERCGGLNIFERRRNPPAPPTTVTMAEYADRQETLKFEPAVVTYVYMVLYCVDCKHEVEYRLPPHKMPAERETPAVTSQWATQPKNH